MNTLKMMATALALVAGLGSASQAQAATRTLCYELLFRDDRYDCPTSSDPGVRRACQQSYHNFAAQPDGDYTNPVGGYVEVWDKDTTSADEYIGTWVIGGTGTRCVTFEWEGASYSNGESHPDLYIRWKPKVRATTGAPTVVAVNMSGTRYADVSWRDDEFSNCTTGSSCSFGFYHLVTTDSTTERGGRAMSLDSAQHSLQVYTTLMDADDIEMGWPATGSAAFNRHYFEVGETRADEGQSAAHEVGHVLQMQLFGQDDLVDDCSLNGSGHSLNSEEYESCVTTEGWAGYVAAVSFWDPNNSGSAPSRHGHDITASTPYAAVCEDNANIELQAIKSFWDLDDTLNEVASGSATMDDTYSIDTLFIADGWSQFANGTANRQNDENDVDGVNLWDYYYANSVRYGSAVQLYQTLLYHNCMNLQTPG